MKIIFLDIDGVLNHELFFVDRYIRRMARKNDGGKPIQTNELTPSEIKRAKEDQIDPISVSFLNEIIKETGAKVVISSTWRKFQTLDELQKILNHHGFIGEIIGATPIFHENKSLRGNEILAWIDENKSRIGKPHYNFKEYVILDDDSDMLYWQRDNFILIDPYCGITPRIVFRACKILGSKDSEITSP